MEYNSGLILSHKEYKVFKFIENNPKCNTTKVCNAFRPIKHANKTAKVIQRLVDKKLIKSDAHYSHIKDTSTQWEITTRGMDALTLRKYIAKEHGHQWLIAVFSLILGAILSNLF